MPVNRRKLTFNLDEGWIEDPLTTWVQYSGVPRLEFSPDGQRARLIVEMDPVLAEDLIRVANLNRAEWPDEDFRRRVLERLTALEAREPNAAD